MTALSIGDLAQGYVTRHRNTALKQDMTRLSTEISTGQVTDVRQVMGGNAGYLVDIESRLEMLSGYDVATSESALYATGMQTALTRVGDLSSDLGGKLLIAGKSAVASAVAHTGHDARAAMDAMVGGLNMEIAGRHMFGGTATDRAPLADAETILDALKVAVAGAGTPDEIQLAARDWFDDPAGYKNSAYFGSDEALAPIALSQDTSVTLDVTVMDSELRDMLRLTAVAALAADPALGLDAQAQKELFNTVGVELIGARDNVISLQAEVGSSQERIDQIATRHAAEKTSLDYAKSTLLGVDPYEAATKLEEVQFQLQSLYAVTARMSQLSLLNYL